MREVVKMKDIVVFALTSSIALADEICVHLGIKRGEISVKHFADGEIIDRLHVVHLRLGEVQRAEPRQLIEQRHQVSRSFRARRPGILGRVTGPSGWSACG